MLDRPEKLFDIRWEADNVHCGRKYWAGAVVAYFKVFSAID
jgi:hypothetical protein